MLRPAAAAARPPHPLHLARPALHRAQSIGSLSPTTSAGALDASDCASLPDAAPLSASSLSPAVGPLPHSPAAAHKQPLARRLGALKLAASAGLASASSVHQIFQEHLSLVVRAPCADLASCYFSLARSDRPAPAPCDPAPQPDAASPFYTSELCEMSLNPSWDLAGGNLHFPPHALQQSRFVLSMFAAHAHAHSHAHAHAHPAAPDGPSAACDETHLIWSRAIDLSDMLYLGPDLADLDMHFAPNTLLFELDDGFYAPATADRSAGSRPARDPTDADVVPVKVPKDRVLPSYRYPHLVRIMSVCASVSAVEEETEAILARSTTRLAALEAAESRAAEAQAVRARIRAAEKAAMELTQETQMLQVRLHEMRAAVRQRRQRLAKLAAGKRDERQSLMRARDGLALTRKEMSRTLLHITQRRQQHIADLQTIFPIAAHEDGCPTIRGIKLPNTNFAGQDDERIATALGFTAHLVTLLAYYLDVPLRYYMLPISSRSTVWDVVSLQFQGSKEFPLFARGSERIRFEYAVFLINKNIEQLLNHTGRPVKNLRNTLPNVRALCAVVAAWATGGDADGAVDWSGVRRIGAALSDGAASARGSSAPSEGDGPAGPAPLALALAPVAASAAIAAATAAASAARPPRATVPGPARVFRRRASAAPAPTGDALVGSAMSPAGSAMSPTGSAPSPAGSSLRATASPAASPPLTALSPASLSPASPSRTAAAAAAAAGPPPPLQPRSPSPAPRPPRGVRHVASAPRLSLVSRLLWGAAGAADPLRPTIGAGADPEADGDADDDVL